MPEVSYRITFRLEADGRHWHVEKSRGKRVVADLGRYESQAEATAAVERLLRSLET